MEIYLASSRVKFARIGAEISNFMAWESWQNFFSTMNEKMLNGNADGIV